MLVFIFIFSLASHVYSIKEFVSSPLKIKACFPLIFCFMKEENVIIGYVHFCANTCFLFGIPLSTLSLSF